MSWKNAFRFSIALFVIMLSIGCVSVSIVFLITDMFFHGLGLLILPFIIIPLIAIVFKVYEWVTRLT